MKFLVQTFDNSGVSKTFEETAETELELRNKLKERGLFISDIKPIDDTNKISAVNQKNKYKLSGNDLENFCYQMRLLLNAGLTVAEAIDELKTTNASSSKMLDFLILLNKKIKEGEPVSAAISNIADNIPNYFIGLLKTGELTGDLVGAFEKTYFILAQKRALKSKLTASLVYPSLLILLSIAFFIFIVIHIIPNISLIFEDLNIQLPLITKFVIKLSNFLKNYLLLILISFIAFIYSFILISKTLWFNLQKERIIFKMPIIKKIMMNYTLAQFSEILAALLSKNVSIVKAVSAAFDASPSYILLNKKDAVINDLTAGAQLSTALDKINFFPKVVIRLIKTGERANKLPDISTNICALNKEELENRLKILTSFVEPILMITVGILITFLILAVVLPIVKMRITG